MFLSLKKLPDKQNSTLLELVKEEIIQKMREYTDFSTEDKVCFD